MSSPTSSFLVTPPPTDTANSPSLQNSFPPPPPPLVPPQPPAFERSPTRGQFGRNSRSSGVFRRIQRKEAFENQPPPFTYFGVNPGATGAFNHSFGASYKVRVLRTNNSVVLMNSVFHRTILTNNKEDYRQMVLIDDRATR